MVILSSKDKEFAEVSVQEEGAGAADEKVGLEAAMLKSQSKNNIQSLMASGHDSALDLSDEQAWVSFISVLTMNVCCIITMCWTPSEGVGDTLFFTV